MAENATETISIEDAIANSILKNGANNGGSQAPAETTKEEKPGDGEDSKDEEAEKLRIENEKIAAENTAKEIKKEEVVEDAAAIEISESDLNELIVSQYTKYGIKDADEVQFRLEDYPELVKENESLRKELDEANKAPKLDENQNKLLEYVKNFDGSNAEALADYAYLQKIDPSKMSDEDVLKEWFVRTSEMDRERSVKKFERTFATKYTSDDAEIQEDLDFDKERDAKLARKELSKLKEAVKLEEKQAEKAPEEDKNFTEISGKYKNEFDKSMKGFTSLTIEKGFGKPVIFELSPEQVKTVDIGVKDWLNKPSTYKDGKIEGFDPDGLKRKMVMAMFPDEVTDFIFKEAFKQGEMSVRKEYNGKKPEKTETSGAPSGQKPLTIQDAIEEALMRKK